MKKLFLHCVIFCFVFLTSCKEDEEPAPATFVCGVELSELTWLQEHIEELKKENINYYKYYQIEKDGESYIIPYFCCPVCNYAIPILNCNGENIGYYGDDLFPFEEFQDIHNPQLSKLIWEPDQFKCYDPYE